MLRLVNLLAGGGALTALAVAVWRDYGLVAGLRRAALAYIGVFIVSALLALVVRAGVLAEGEAGGETAPAGRGRPEGRAEP